MARIWQKVTAMTSKLLQNAGNYCKLPEIDDRYTSILQPKRRDRPQVSEKRPTYGLGEGHGERKDAASLREAETKESAKATDQGPAQTAKSRTQPRGATQPDNAPGGRTKTESARKRGAPTPPRAAAPLRGAGPLGRAA